MSAGGRSEQKTDLDRRGKVQLQKDNRPKNETQIESHIADGTGGGGSVSGTFQRHVAVFVNQKKKEKKTIHCCLRLQQLYFFESRILRGPSGLRVRRVVHGRI